MALGIVLVLSALAVAVQGGIVAAPLPYVAPYASALTTHVTHHSVAAPYVAAPSVVAAPVAAAPLLSAPLVTAPRVFPSVVGAAPLVL